MKYVQKIDALRALAVLMVVMSHWIPKTASKIPFGEIGVDIFFVISGFLITGILLHEREKARLASESQAAVLKNFVIRRALRIFPIYYLSLFLFWILQDFESYHIRENFVYYATYTSNILFFKANAWDGYLAPLWSLAVEEQFYLVWPILMIWTPSKHVLKVIVLSIAIGVVFPYFFHNEMVKVLTPSCMNALGGGALLAWLKFNKPELLQKASKVVVMLALVSAGALFFTFFVNDILEAQVRTMISMISVASIMYCIGILQPRKLLEFVLNHPALIFVGQISYGIYLYHNLVSVVWKNIVVVHLGIIPASIGVSAANAVFLTIKFVLLLGVAWLSYNLIEKRFLNLKKYFVIDKVKAS